MAKGAKKKNRKLRRQIRKTIGALLMVSAITVAAIPVQDVSANPESTEVPRVAVDGFYYSGGKLDSGGTYPSSSIPNVWELGSGKDTIIYNSGDNIYQFAYVPEVSGNLTKVAVILRYGGGVQNSSLTIPNELWAYRPLMDNASNNTYNCLVSKNDSFLYYETEVQSRDPDSGALLYRVADIHDETSGERLIVNEYQLEQSQSGGGLIYPRQEQVTVPGENGTTTTEIRRVEHQVDPIMEPYYNPCYYNQISAWENLGDEELYYKKEDGTYSHPNGDDNYVKIVAEVAYIGAEKIEEGTRDDGAGNLVGTGSWTLAGSGKDDINRFINEPSEGVFADNANITNLTIGDNIKGISDYAFQGCSTLSSVKLGNYLQTLGNGAFANCIRLTNCDIAVNANIQAIGKDAFYNCTMLESFQVPINVRAIGDCCFEGCTALKKVELQGGDQGTTMLNTIGNHAFKNCASLGELIFPSNYAETVNVGIVEGCRSLQKIQVNNKDFNFVEVIEGTGDDAKVVYGFEDLLNDAVSSFYIIGPLPKSEEDRSKSPIHKTANDNAIAFKYPDQELYEVVREEKGATGSNPDPAKITYQVNDKNSLVDVRIEGSPENITLPEEIGPYHISSIGKGSFSDNCTLQRITIPASVTAIDEEAFVGCHELKTVIFTDASTITGIGKDAFKTQVVTCQDTLSQHPELTFVGAMMKEDGTDTIPFIYAMNGVSNINNANQEMTYITCHSGWPTNLEVRYNFDPLTQTGEAQLVGYPRYEMIKDKVAATQWVASLPYVTGVPDDLTDYKPDPAKPNENFDTYLSMVLEATAYYDYMQNPGTGTMPNQPTENAMSVVNSTLNVVVPNSVDSIKPGLFSGYTYDENGGAKAVDGIKPDENIQSILLNGVDEVEPYTFKGCTALERADIIGSKLINDYAFDGCEELAAVTLGTNLEDTGKRPFRGCDKLTVIECLDSDFSYNNGILYRNFGSNIEIVECLESRGAAGGIGSYSVGPEELVGVTSIKDEAFMDCDEIGKVDLSATTVDVIPEKCFSETDDLNSVVLPDTVATIETDAFTKSGIRLLTIPGRQSFIAPDAFVSDPQQTIIFECIEGTTADRYAKQYDYINPEYGKVHLEHTVYFWDYPNYPDTEEKEIFYRVKVIDGQDAVPPATPPSHDGVAFSRWTDYTNIVRDTDVYPIFGDNVYVVTFIDTIDSKILSVQNIESGKSATPPEPPVHEGYTFKEWQPSYNNITADTTILTQYVDNSGDSSRHTVTFYSYDGLTVISQQKINDGEAATAPMPPVREGYTFVAWVPGNYSNVTQDMSIIASYTPNSGSGSNPSGSPGASGSPGPSGSPGASGSASPSASASASPSASPEVTKYTVSVSGGSGSGRYAAGEIVAVNAYYMGEGQVFDRWTSSTAGVGFSNPNATSATFTMPAANVAITATYKTGSGATTTTNTGGGTGAGGGTGGSGTTSNNGTTVEVTKPGISNTNYAGATVSGATDNFIVKVTEDQAATDAVIAALQARYGDISRIKYLPMDISLYDSTGRTKIADTTGITVNLTLPIPDDLVQYAGNNKVAAVANGALEDLNVRFTTVGGVPCVNFTATHFSPYVIYVDTANLTEATIDTTPKTGDPIHPKWFLALGMACVSLILFFKRDKVVVKPKTKTA